MSRKFSLSKRLLLSFTLIFFFVVAAVSVAFFAYMQSNTLQQNAQTLRNHSSIVAQQYQSLLDNANQISVRTFFSTNIRNTMSKCLYSEYDGNYFDSHVSESSTINKELYTIAGMDITDIIVNIYNENGFFSSKYYPVSWDRICKSADNGHIAQTQMRLQSSAISVSRIDSLYWTGQRPAPKTAYISLARRYLNYATQKVYGTIEILIPVKKFTGLFNDTVLNTSLYKPDGELLIKIGSDDPSLPGWADMPFENGQLPDQGALSLRNAGNNCCCEAVGNYGLYILTVQRADYAVILRYLALIGLASLLLYAVSVATYVIVLRRATEPLNRLVRTLKNVSWDRLEVELNLDNVISPDLDILQETYRAMYAKINESINQIVNARLNEQRAVYLALQSQISPHFIYNTIANISACAYENGVFKIVDICDKLSGLLRYATDYSTDVSNIAHEIEYTINYLDLMKLRYEDNFMYSISCDQGCEQLHIPRLMIQTIIENCFKHAFPKTVPPWVMNIYCYCKEDWWFVDLNHNGLPIPQEQLQKIIEESARLYNDQLNELCRNGVGGLGLLNSITRLRMCCDDQICFECIPAENGFCIMRFGGKVICANR